MSSLSGRRTTSFEGEANVKQSWPVRGHFVFEFSGVERSEHDMSVQCVGVKLESIGRYWMEKRGKELHLSIPQSVAALVSDVVEGSKEKELYLFTSLVVGVRSVNGRWGEV